MTMAGQKGNRRPGNIVSKNPATGTGKNKVKGGSSGVKKATRRVNK